MASASRTLTLKLLADINDFTTNLNKSQAKTQSFADEVTAFGKKAAVAFTAAAAAIGAYASAAIQNAARDEAAQRNLALTLQNTTNATNEQIAGVEKWIAKTSLAIGVTDDQLRPALSRLARSTNDVGKAQELLNLALDVSTATGKPLETVANALGKAYDGNTAALGKLGLGLDSSVLKSKDFDAIFKQLTGTFGNFAENEAQSAQKQMERVRIAIDEANESIGAALLPVVQELTAWLLEHFVPALQATIGGLTGDKSVLKSLDGTYKAFYDWGERIRDVINVVISLKDEIMLTAGVIAGMFVASKIAAGVTATITAINLLIKTYNALKASAFVAGVAAAFALNPLLGAGAAVAGTAAIIGATKFIEGLGGGQQTDTTALGNYQMTTGTTLGLGSSGVGGIAGIGSVSGMGGGSIGGGGAVASASASAALAKIQFDMDTVETLVDIAQNPTKYQDPRYAQGVSPASMYINVTGAIDPEGTARTIVNTLNNSYYRGTGGAGNLIND